MGVQGVKDAQGATIIDGKAVAQKLLQQVAADAAHVEETLGRPPGLVVVRVGDDPASKVYVNAKQRAAERNGVRSWVYALPESTSRGQLLDKLATLNANPEVDGILVQLPLPGHLDENEVVAAVAPHKDVDGFHPLNIGRLWSGRPGFVACTPRGIMHLLAATGVALQRKEAVVIGRSNIVGKPVAALLLQANATVTMCHSHTVGLADVCRRADVVIAAVGRPQFVRRDWIKPGAVVIDVGINRMQDGSLAGDVDFDGARAVAGHITPVPGGVGPLTIAMLLANTVKAARGFDERV